MKRLVKSLLLSETTSAGTIRRIFRSLLPDSTDQSPQPPESDENPQSFECCRIQKLRLSTRCTPGEGDLWSQGWTLTVREQQGKRGSQNSQNKLKRSTVEEFDQVQVFRDLGELRQKRSAQEGE